MASTTCPFGLPTCRCPGQPKDCTKCAGCQCRGKFPHLCRERANAHFYPTLAERAQLDEVARQRGDFHTGPFKDHPDNAPLLQEIVSAWLKDNAPKQ